MNTITIELCAEDRARLDNILTALTSGRAHASAPETTQEPPKAQPEETPAPQAEQPKAEETAVPVVALADIQRKVVELSAAGKKAEVRGIVKAYAAKVSDIPVDKTAEVWQQLIDLEG